MSAATPGSSFPSSSSSDAPPPVERKSKSAGLQNLLAAVTESPPPTMVSASALATASASSMVPLAKLVFSKTPIGPFQRMVFAPATTFLKSWMATSPMSIPSQSSSMAPPSEYGAVTFVSASSLNSCATLVSAGRWNLMPFCSASLSSSSERSMNSSWTSDLPIWYP